MSRCSRRRMRTSASVSMNSLMSISRRSGSSARIRIPSRMHHRPRRQRVGQHAARVGGVVVGEAGHGPARLEVAQVLDEERGVERVGVVVVDGGLRGGGEGAAVLVVRVLGDEQAAVLAHARRGSCAASEVLPEPVPPAIPTRTVMAADYNRRLRWPLLRALVVLLRGGARPASGAAASSTRSRSARSR